MINDFICKKWESKNIIQITFKLKQNIYMYKHSQCISLKNIKSKNN